MHPRDASPTPLPAAAPQSVPLGRAHRAGHVVLCLFAEVALATPLAVLAAEFPATAAALASPERLPVPAWLALACLGIAAVGLVTVAVGLLPAALARCSVTVGGTALEVTEHPSLWRSGRTTRVPWEAVRLAVFRTAEFRRKKAAVSRPVLDLFTDRPFTALPAFATSRPTGPDGAHDAHGRPVGSHLLRIGASSASLEDAVRQVAGLAGAHRPDLFHPAPGTVIGPSAPWATRIAAPASLCYLGASFIGLAAAAVVQFSVQ
ncbi:hypothetical protein [Nocardiopsis halophila]|uniref:hypothetical protein n=1 Tax=Nocardiopsis halophila TaxID=141692 RepID=UPI00034B36E8|nr:hypothetical protein [Nocardiopsis halophila]